MNTDLWTAAVVIEGDVVTDLSIWNTDTGISLPLARALELKRRWRENKQRIDGIIKSKVVPMVAAMATTPMAAAMVTTEKWKRKEMGTMEGKEMGTTERMLKRMNVRKTPDIEDSIVILFGHPFYYHHALHLSSDPSSWNGSLLRDPVPSNRAIGEMIRKELKIVATLVLGSDPFPIWPPLIIPPEPMKFAQIISPFSRTTAWPSKNVGKLIYLSSSLPQSIPPDQRISIIAVDGIIAAGKTTLMKEIEREEPYARVEFEKTDDIYAVIAHCREKGIVGKERRALIEETVYQNEKKVLESIDPLTKRVYIERNWLYARWVFGEYDDPFPVVDEQLVKDFEAAGVRLDGTIVVWTPPDEAFRRLIQRGTRDEVSVETESKLEERLRILFDSPYEWAFARRLPDR